MKPLHLIELLPIAVVAYWMGGLVLNGYFKRWSDGIGVARWLAGVAVHAAALGALSALWCLT